jgi:hypothetical protein
MKGLIQMNEQNKNDQVTGAALTLTQVGASLFWEILI